MDLKTEISTIDMMHIDQMVLMYQQQQAVLTNMQIAKSVWANRGLLEADFDNLDVVDAAVFSERLIQNYRDTKVRIQQALEAAGNAHSTADIND